MISEGTQQSSGAWTRNSDPDAAYREEFLKLLACLELEPTQAMALAEIRIGRPFETCSPAQLVPVLQQILELLRSHRGPEDTRAPWHV
jgi:hypothetical protein